jgi:hypothetical protein
VIVNPTPPVPISLVYEQLLTGCPVLRFPEPWAFVPPGQDCHATVADPPATLASLRATFDVAALEVAGVLDRSPEGQPRLHPNLCEPGGTIVALRAGPRLPPFELLTAAGCVSGRTVPVLAALADAFTQERRRPLGTIFAPVRIADVALLRALGLPATLGTGLSDPSVERLRALEAAFVRPEWRVAGALQAGPVLAAAGLTEPFEATAVALTVTLLDWSLVTLDAPPALCLDRLRAQFGELQCHLGFACSWLSAWRSSPSLFEALRYRLRFQDVSLIRDYLELSDEYWEDLCPAVLEETSAQAHAGPPVHFAEAQAAVVALLAATRGSPWREDDLQRAILTYEGVSRRDLVLPLQQWALAHPDPVVRNLGTELATICTLLHRISPSLQETLADRLAYPWTSEGGAVPPQLLAQYLQLSARFAGLVKVLDQWNRKATRGR